MWMRVWMGMRMRVLLVRVLMGMRDLRVGKWVILR